MSARGGADGCVVGVQFGQPCHLRLRGAQQWQEREHLTPDAGDGFQRVVTPGQVRSFMRQDRIELAGVQGRHGAGGHDDGGHRPATQ